jgi:hypothetical protein
MAAKKARTDKAAIPSAGDEEGGPRNPCGVRQQAFIAEFLGPAHRCATAAARNLKYGKTPGSHRTAGYRMMTNVHVKAALAEAMKAAQMTADEAAARLGVAARGLGKYLSVDGGGNLVVDLRQLLADGNGDLIVEFAEGPFGQVVKFANPQDAQKFIVARADKVAKPDDDAEKIEPQRVEVDLNVVVHGVAGMLKARADRVKVHAAAGS